MVLLIALMLAASVPPELKAFYQKWPTSTRELGRWAMGSPKTAPLWMGWAGQSDENLNKARKFVGWILENRSANPYDFADQHKDWQVFERLRKYPEEGLNGFVDWCRKHRFSCHELFTMDAAAVRVARGFAVKRASDANAPKAAADEAKPAEASDAGETAEASEGSGEKQE